MKICRICKKKKSLSSYYAHKQMADGYLNICIICTKRRIHKHRRQNIEKIRAYDRERGRTEKRLKANRERARSYKKAYLALLRFRAKFPEKYLAHGKVARALKAKKLVKKVCSVCGEKKTEAHHPDYSKPLKVVWLCVKHHRELHRKYKN